MREEMNEITNEFNRNLSALAVAKFAAACGLGLSTPTLWLRQQEKCRNTGRQTKEQTIQ
jgi:hypothetical protein